MSIRKARLMVYNMTCTSCENRVEEAIKKLHGVLMVKANYSGQFTEVEYDDTLCSLSDVEDAIRNVGYTIENSNNNKFIGMLIILVVLTLLSINTRGFNIESMLNNASYAVIFVIGILTSIHCVGMCGGIMLSQILSKQSKSNFRAIQPAILYNLGRVISYTILGGIIGALGSVFSLSLTVKIVIQIFAGAFMLIMGLNMIGFNAFRKLNIRLPNIACRIKSKPKTPFLVGFFNGLMPCGPLQTMQLFALGTGSPLRGALSMFIFAIGTVPLMLAFGTISGLLNKGYTKKILKFSGILIIFLGITMGNRGLALAGVNINPLSLFIRDTGNASNNNGTTFSSSNVDRAVMKDGIQILNMSAVDSGYSPDVLYVKKGVPVKWIIDGQQLNYCNNTIVIPALNQQYTLKSGENIIEFTPGDKSLNFSCWMGMIRGTIKVVDDLNSLTPSSDNFSDASSNTTSIQTKPSIYGDDISKVPTSRLVVKTQILTDTQNIKVKGIGYELEPLIIVAKKDIKTKMTLDLTSFDNPDGNYSIVDVNTGEILKNFQGKRGIVEVEFMLNNLGAYGIVGNKELLCLIEAVDNIDSLSIDSIRKKYLP